MVQDQELAPREGKNPIDHELENARRAAVIDKLPRALHQHFRGMGDALFFGEFSGSTLRKSDRQLLAIAVSAHNRCEHCSMAHGRMADEMLRQDGEFAPDKLIKNVRDGAMEGLTPKLAALISIAQRVADSPHDLTREHVDRAKQAGASDQDVQLTILITAMMCMVNRVMDAPPTTVPPTSHAS